MRSVKRNTLTIKLINEVSTKGNRIHTNAIVISIAISASDYLLDNPLMTMPPFIESYFVSNLGFGIAQCLNSIIVRLQLAF